MTISLLDSLSRSLAVFAFILAVTWSAYLIGRWLLANAPLSVRLCASCVMGCMGLVVIFFLTLSVGLFQAHIALPVLFAGAGIIHWRLEGSQAWRHTLAEDARTIADWFRILKTSRYRMLFGAAALMACLRAVRTLLAPPMTWDALTYQLVKPARWVQYGEHRPDLFPDSPGYYEFFPELGNIFWAWPMLVTNDDSILSYAALGVFLALLLGGYGAARALGQGPVHATLTASVIAYTPAVFSFFGSFHVDNTQLTLYLLGTALLLSSATGAYGWRSALPAALAFSMSMGTKTTMYPIAAAGIAVTLLILWKSRSGVKAVFCTAAASGLMILLSLSAAWRAWQVHGSPLYPFPTSFGGRTLFPGNKELIDLLTGTLRPETNKPLAISDLLAFGWNLVHPTFLSQGFQELNFGPAGAALALLGVWGAVEWFRGRQSAPPRLITAFLVLTIIVTGASLLSPLGNMHRNYWSHVTARLMLPGWGALVLLASGALATRARWIFPAALAVHLFVGLPLGFGLIDLWAVGGAAGHLIIAFGSLWVLCFLVGGKLGRNPTLAAALLTVVILPVGLRDLRWKVRHVYYEAQNSLAVYDVHPLKTENRPEYVLWELFDKPGRKIVAVTAGWDQRGHNWYRYPLLGRDLQNQLIYVPITRSGRILDGPDLLSHRDELDFSSWLARLVTREVGYVAALAPASVEVSWMRAHPEIFELMGQTESGASSAYMLKRDAALAWLNRPKTQTGSTSPK